MRIVPLRDCVVVEVVKKEALSEGGVILPEPSHERIQEAVVLDVGWKSRDLCPGNRVLFEEFSGKQFRFDGKDLMFLYEEDIRAVLVEEEQ